MMRTAPIALVSALLVTAACEKQAKLPFDCATIDTRTDPANCGACGQACPAPLHGHAACVDGGCVLAACEDGWLDLDQTVPGCESVANALPATGFVLATPSSSTSLLQHAQTGPAHRNEGVLAEPTPAPVGGATEATDGVHRNLTGVNAFLEDSP